MSASGPKRTCVCASHMSASSAKADITFAGLRFRGRYWGQGGHSGLRRTCRLLTLSGHPRVQNLESYRSPLISILVLPHAWHSNVRRS